MALITYDTHVHYYNLSPGLKQAAMIVQSFDMNPPIPREHLFFDLEDCRNNLLALLDALPNSFDSSRPEPKTSNFLRALDKAWAMLSHVGGKVLLFQSESSVSDLVLLKICSFW